MTLDELMALPHWKLDVMVAESLMGWTNVGRYIEDSVGNDPAGTRRVVPCYSTDRNAAGFVLAEIERRMVIDEFVRELRRLLYRHFGDDDTLPQLWRFNAASPRLICVAAILAVQP